MRMVIALTSHGSLKTSGKSVMQKETTYDLLARTAEPMMPSSLKINSN